MHFFPNRIILIYFSNPSFLKLSASCPQPILLLSPFTTAPLPSNILNIASSAIRFTFLNALLLEIPFWHKEGSHNYVCELDTYFEVPQLNFGSSSLKKNVGTKTMSLDTNMKIIIKVQIHSYKLRKILHKCSIINSVCSKLLFRHDPILLNSFFILFQQYFSVTSDNAS